MKYRYIFLSAACGLISCSQESHREHAGEESFIIETVRSTKEKKYSELQEDLVCSLEEYVRLLTDLLHNIADSQKKSMDELRRIIENTPKMSRVRIEKELKQLELLKKNIESIGFF